MNPPTTLQIPALTVPLEAGELYAGLVLGADGTPSHHLVLLPGEAEDGTWDSATAWAREVGGELPSRQEQSLLFANLKSQFAPQWYWSAEQYEDDSSCAWTQGFNFGYQHDHCKGARCRARAVRRLTL